MSHLVLARKWRPRDFETLVGQQHVVRALTHALATQRLHHAYLLTGTRGVGKTTIARILAKAINCESGPTPKPCGRCAACTGIDSGRFVDYIEMDAASNRGVDEMTQLLENAVYSPASARYKVYVIDEVHMLSTHAFNAMLKTLEEPPPHVLFVLATTDPQKVPVTVLSRCLQFNLRNMVPQAIADHLARVLEAESVGFEAGALALLGRSAGGSMRDALSLLDQAIAFGGGCVEEAAVREMLGAVDQAWLEDIMAALAAGDGPRLVGLADRMAEVSTPFERVLEDLARMIHRIALAQAGVTPDRDSAGSISEFASMFAPEDVQAFYQIVVHGARDLPLAPDPHAGFSMLLLRLLAFRPLAGVGGAGLPSDAAPVSGPQSSVAGGAAAQALAALKSAAGTRSERGRSGVETRSASSPKAAIAPPVGSGMSQSAPSNAPPPALPVTAPQVSAPQVSAPQVSAPQVSASQVSASQVSASQASALKASPAQGSAGAALDFDGDWPALARALGATGLIGQFMSQSELVGFDGDRLNLRVPIKPLAEPATVARVRDRLAQHFGRPVRLQVEVGRVAGVTAASQDELARSRKLEETREAMEADPFVKTLVADFGGRIVPESVSPPNGPS